MEKKVKNGLVCFSDILGYMTIIQNNDIEKCINIIKEIIINLQDRIIKRFIKNLGEDEFDRIYNNNILEFINKRVHISIVSDSLLFFFDCDNLEDNYNLFIGFITYYKLTLNLHTNS